jgi:lipoyl(octanoyl) transferase
LDATSRREDSAGSRDTQSLSSTQTFIPEPPDACKRRIKNVTCTGPHRCFRGVRPVADASKLCEAGLLRPHTTAIGDNPLATIQPGPLELRRYNQRVISVVQLGRVDYASGLRWQQRLVELRKAGQIGDVLLLLEHTPVITLGRNAKAANVLASPEMLAARGVEVYECDRGGDVTFHGPGQLVGYPIFDLRGFERSEVSGLGSQERQVGALGSSQKRQTLGAVDYVRRLENVLIRTCGDFEIPAKRVAGLTGVWTEKGGVVEEHRGNDHERSRGPSTPQGDRFADRPAPLRMTTRLEEAKIAAIGVHISRSVTSHGFALNVNMDLSLFDLIVPCGIASKPVTSMQRELGREVELPSVGEAVARNFGVVFGRQMLWVDTLDALLGNTVGVPERAPEELRELHGEDETSWA